MNELGDAFDDLLRRAVDGDRDAFAELWRATHPGLLRYLRVLCGPDNADDIASDAWLKVMRALGTFSGDESAFRGWVAVVARNHAIDVGRRAVRRPEQLAPALDEQAAGLEPDTADLALERLSTEQALQLLADLPSAVAEMVALRVVVGLDVADVARIVGKTPGSVRVAVHRGLRSLAARLASDPTAGPL